MKIMKLIDFYIWFKKFKIFDIVLCKLLGGCFMVGCSNFKCDKVLEVVCKIVKFVKIVIIDLLLFYGCVSVDDIEVYNVDMLVVGSVYVVVEIFGWDCKSVCVIIVNVDVIVFEGIVCFVFFVIDCNMLFLFDFVMGELISMYCDIFMVVYLILIVEEGKEFCFYVSDDGSDLESCVSYM